MNLWTALKTDPELEKTKGVVLDYGEIGKITILRAGGANVRFAKRRKSLFAPWARQIEMGNADDAKLRELLILLFAETIVIGWEGVKGPDDKHLEFNKENVIKVLGIEQLYADISSAANDYTLFLEARETSSADSIGAEPAPASAAETSIGATGTTDAASSGAQASM